MSTSKRPWWFDGRDVFHKKPGTNLDQIIIPLGQVISDTFTADGAVSSADVMLAVEAVNLLDNDKALMRGVSAVIRMHRLRVGDLHDHANAFRKAAGYPEKERE